MGLSTGEILLIVLVFILLFGAKSIPDLAKGFGKGMSELKKVKDEISREINSDNELVNTAKQVKRTIVETGEELKSDFLKSDIAKDAEEISKNLNKKM